MALLECPECGKKVSTEASACPSCGGLPPKSRKGDTVMLAESKKMTRNEKKAFINAGGKIVLSKSQKIVSALFFILLVFMFSKFGNSNNQNTAVPQSDQINTAKNQLDEAMKDPRKVRYLECQGINPWQEKPAGWASPSKKECAELDRVLGKEAEAKSSKSNNE